MERTAIGKISNRAAQNFLGWVTCESHEELETRLNELIDGSLQDEPVAFMRASQPVHTCLVKSAKYGEVGAIFFAEQVGDDVANGCYEALLNEYFPG